MTSFNGITAWRKWRALVRALVNKMVCQSGTFFQMLGPAVFNDVVEKWADELILPHHFVKLVDKILNIL